MSSQIGGKAELKEKRRLKQWMYKFNTQKPISADYMFPVKTAEDKNFHYLSKLIHPDQVFIRFL